MTLRFEARAQRDLASLERTMAVRITAKLKQLADDPFGCGSTALVGRAPLRRLRVGDWRVLYVVDAEAVTVVRIGHRREIYE